MSLFQLLRSEFKAIFTNPVVALTVFGGVIFYSFLYPLPYINQTPTEQEVAVVNLDKSQASYQLERMVDATPQVNIATRSGSIEEAKERLLTGEVNGIFVIPEHFYRDLMLEKSPTLAFAGDASYFLVYGTIVEGLAHASGTLAGKVNVVRLLSEGVPLSMAEQQYAAFRVNMKPTFNPEIGYLNYVVPAVFVLILQQTLIMASGLLGATQRTSSGYWTQAGPLATLLTRVSVLGIIYLLLAMYYFGFSLDFYAISQLGTVYDLFSIFIPMFMCSTAIGVVLGQLVPRRELVTVIALFLSMPLIFTSGFIWPVESIPTPLLSLSYIFPSGQAIPALLKVNHMGANRGAITDHLIILWLQSLLWLCVAFYLLKKSKRAIS